MVPKKTTKQSDYPFTLEWVPVADCFADRDVYQRDSFKLFVQRCATIETFQPGLVGAPIGSRRTDGRIALVDGQQRHEILKRMGWTHFWCAVRSGLSIEDESRLFVSLNFDRNNVRSWDQYRAMRVSGDEVVLGADVICRSLGFEVVGKVKTDNGIGCCKTIIDIYTSADDVYRNVPDEKKAAQLSGPEVLAETLRFLDAHWRQGGADKPEWRKARTAAMIRGIARFLFVNVGVNADDLGQALRAAVPSMILIQASGSGGGHGRGVDPVIQDIWDRYTDGQEKKASRRASRPKKRPPAGARVAVAVAA